VLEDDFKSFPTQISVVSEIFRKYPEPFNEAQMRWINYIFSVRLNYGLKLHYLKLIAFQAQCCIDKNPEVVRAWDRNITWKWNPAGHHVPREYIWDVLAEKDKNEQPI
jgi:hypothetical protein